METALNEAAPGDPRDTTTPQAMLGDLDRLLLGDVLSPASRVRLTDWLIACRTGDQKIRAGLPKDWRCGDKTGGGGYGTNNDIAILWPPGRRPILVRELPHRDHGFARYQERCIGGGGPGDRRGSRLDEMVAVWPLA